MDRIQKKSSLYGGDQQVDISKMQNKTFLEESDDY